MDDDRLVKSAEELATELEPDDLDQALSRITAAAVDALPQVDYASITIRHEDGSLETVAPTDGTLFDLDAKQYELREGPCYEAATDTPTISAPDLATDERFPRYAQHALDIGIRAQAGIRLFDTDGAHAALNLYSRTAGAFRDDDGLAALFAHQSAMVIGYAREVRNLQEAAKTRDLVGQAVGVAMERYELSEQRAFALLTRLSHHHKVELPVVAEAIVSASRSRAAG